MSTQSKAIEGAKEPSQNISFEELVAQRTESRTAPTEDPNADYQPDQENPEPENPDLEPIEEEQPEEEISDEGDDPIEEEEEEPEHDIDQLLSLSPEQIQSLAKKGKSRLLSRIGELTAKVHQAEERASQAETKPLPSIPAEQNPFRELKTVEEIRAKHQELEKVAEETDRILEDHEDYAADDVITLGDKEFTKKQIRQANRNARDAMLKFLPAQHAEIVRSEQRTQMEAAYNAAIPKEIPETQDEESPIGKQFKAMLADPLVDQIRQRVPDIAPQLGYLLAHAAASIHRSQKLKTAKPAQVTPPRPKVPGNPVGAGAARSGAKPAKKEADQAYQEFENTGSTEAWIAARIKQRSQI
jgi:hypothetical protein